jgi:hypothetical protein
MLTKPGITNELERKSIESERDFFNAKLEQFHALKKK